jgi:phosphotriesterase-related protein
MTRRTFLETSAALLTTTIARPATRTDRLATAAPQTPQTPQTPRIMTVRGPIDAAQMGVTLTHEHLLADFRSLDEKAQTPRPYDPADVIAVVTPLLTRVKQLGCRTFVDCTAVGLGRDAALLKRIAEATDLHIVTVTGNYAAWEQRALPPYVFSDSEKALAQRWIDEWTHGIEGTGIRPGLIKLGFSGGPLPAVEQKLIRAAAIAHLETGLTIGAHISGPAANSAPAAAAATAAGSQPWSAGSAFAQIDILEKAGVHPSAWIWIHAQNEKDRAHHVTAARRGAWVSFDGLGATGQPAADYVDMVNRLRQAGLLHRALVSQDAGWYHVGQPHGGTIRAYDAVFTAFIPAARGAGFTQAEIDTLLIRNPAEAFAIGVRRQAARHP